MFSTSKYHRLGLVVPVSSCTDMAKFSPMCVLGDEWKTDGNDLLLLLHAKGEVLQKETPGVIPLPLSVRKALAKSPQRAQQHPASPGVLQPSQHRGNVL